MIICVQHLAEKMAIQKKLNTLNHSMYLTIFFSFLFLAYRDLTATVPPCPSELTECAETDGGERSAGMPRSQSDRLIPVCRDFSMNYQELQEKYFEIIYSTADKVLRTSQANQMKQLKTCLEKETSDVMRQLNIMRRNEVKSLSLVHRDRDELVR